MEACKGYASGEAYLMRLSCWFCCPSFFVVRDFQYIGPAAQLVADGERSTIVSGLATDSSPKYFNAHHIIQVYIINPRIRSIEREGEAGTDRVLQQSDPVIGSRTIIIPF